jgi:hypothetical protein
VANSISRLLILFEFILFIVPPASSQVNPYYTRLRIVNSNHDTSLSEIMMRTDQDTTLYVQGKRSDSGEWDNVMAKWDILDSTLNCLTPSTPGSANSWRFGGLGYCYGRVRVTLGKDSIGEPDTIRIEIRPGCGPMEGDITFLTPLTHVESGDTITAVIRIASLGFKMYGWPYCRPPSFWCFPDSSKTDICYSDSLVPDDNQAPLVITGEGTAQLGKHGGTTYPVKEWFSDGIDTIRFVVYCSQILDSSVHKFYASFGNLPGYPFLTGSPFFVYHRNTGIFRFAGQDRNLSQVKWKGKEYYNLRGQKLPLYGIKRTGGIVLERMIGPDGKANIRKVIPEMKSR